MKVGDEVVPTGVGKTRRWQHVKGVVISVLGGNADVVWDGTNYVDEMAPAEIRVVGHREDVDIEAIGSRVVGRRGRGYVRS